MPRPAASGLLTMLFLTATCATAQSASGDRARNRLAKGERTFRQYCVLCHGEKGDGTGVAAKLYNPPPANLTVSPYSREYMMKIVSLGGGAVGRSPAMPAWGREPGAEAVADVVSYVRSLNARQP